MSKVEKWTNANEDRKKDGLPPIPYDEWSKEHSDTRVAEVIKYLDLDRGGPNWGTRNKQELMKRVLYYISSWGNGLFDKWESKLSNRLGLRPRTVKENYIIPLINEGIIRNVGSQLYFVGSPDRDLATT